jgi:hypothetical protein
VWVLNRRSALVVRGGLRRRWCLRSVAGIHVAHPFRGRRNPVARGGTSGGANSFAHPMGDVAIWRSPRSTIPEDCRTPASLPIPVRSLGRGLPDDARTVLTAAIHFGAGKIHGITLFRFLIEIRLWLNANALGKRVVNRYSHLVFCDDSRSQLTWHLMTLTDGPVCLPGAFSKPGQLECCGPGFPGPQGSAFPVAVSSRFVVNSQSP